MDFRTVDPKTLEWSRGFGGAARVKPQPSVQTPRCSCRVVETAPGRARVELRLAGCEMYEPFAAWCEALEAAAQPVARGAADKALFATVLRANRGSMRVTAFEECEWFDAENNFLAGDAAAAARAAAGEATCVLALTGAWSSEARWGLRWKVVQVKLFPQGDVSETTASDAPTAAYAFLD